MIIALAAAAADFSQFSWKYNKGKQFDLKLSDKPAIKIEPDDLIGLRKATRGPTTGSYQVVVAKYPQLIYRSVPEEKILAILPHLDDYVGIPEKTKRSDGKRHTAITHQTSEQSDKQSAQFYKTPGRHTEAPGGYDKGNYQWRKVVRPTKVTTKEHNKTRDALKDGDVIGMRYMRKSHGGYLITPVGERIIISHEVYEDITNNSDILPRAQQERGFVDLHDIKANLPKGTKIRINIPRPPKAQPTVVKPSKEKYHSVKEFVQEHKELTTQFEYEDLDEEFAFEDEDEVLNPPDEFEFDDAEETVNSKQEPQEPEELPEDFEEDEDDPEMDFQDDEEVDEEGEPIVDEDAVYAEEGVVLKTKDNSEWVVVAVEKQGLSDILHMYNPEKKTLRNYKVHAGDDLRNSRTVTVSRVISGSKLEKLIMEASEQESKSGTRL